MSTTVFEKQGVRPSIMSNNLAAQAAQEEIETEQSPSLKTKYENLMTQLEVDGIPKDQVSTIGQKIILEQKKSILEKKGSSQEELDNLTINRWWYVVASENNYVNPFYARNTKETDAQLHQDNSSINTRNSEMLVVCDKIIDLCRTIKEKSNECEELEIIFGKKEMKEFYRQRNTMLENCKNAIDNKTKIPKNTELFLLECLATVMGNTNKCGQIFQKIIMNHMEEQGKFLTQKQATKFQSGGKQSQLDLLKPTSRDFAIYEGYTGTQCTCGSWRVRPKLDHNNNWECFDCEKIIPRQHIPRCSFCQIPLYTDRIEHIIKTERCENCNEKVVLPQEMIDQVNNL